MTVCRKIFEFISSFLIHRKGLHLYSNKKKGKTTSNIFSEKAISQVDIEKKKRRAVTLSKQNSYSKFKLQI